MRHRSRRAWDARSGHHHARRHTDGAPRAHQSSSAGGLFETKTATDRFATRQELGGITTHDISFAVGEAPFAQERARCGQTVPTRARDRGFRSTTLNPSVTSPHARASATLARPPKCSVACRRKADRRRRVEEAFLASASARAAVVSKPFWLCSPLASGGDGVAHTCVQGCDSGGRDFVSF